jgi:hypothetical protein
VYLLVWDEWTYTNTIHPRRMVPVEMNSDEFAHVSPEYYVIRPPESESEVALVIASTERMQFSLRYDAPFPMQNGRC